MQGHCTVANVVVIFPFPWPFKFDVKAISRKGVSQRQKLPSVPTPPQQTDQTYSGLVLSARETNTITCSLSSFMTPAKDETLCYIVSEIIPIKITWSNHFVLFLLILSQDGECSLRWKNNAE